jgi:hypothetical protein
MGALFLEKPQYYDPGFNTILSSCLVPGSVYSNVLKSIGPAYKQLLSQGIQSVLGLLVAGGAFHFQDIL